MLPEFRKPLYWLLFSISGPIIGKQVDVALLLNTRCHAALPELITHALSNSYNTGWSALPDMYALAVGRCAPSSVMRTYQAMHSSLCYNYYITGH